MRTYFLLAACLVLTQASAQTKRALIVAVGTYMPTSKIPPIASVNDVKYIKAALTSQGFAEGEMQTLLNTAATKAAILKALDDLAGKSSKGDIVTVHFSMHGQQIRDQKGEGKDEDDGLDEALLPYDVKKGQYYPGVYTGEAHLRDDELGMKLTAIRNKLGVNGSLLVLIDACHSGTATRAGEGLVSRGEPVPFYDPENPMETVVNLPVKESFFDALTQDAANMVVISGSGPHQQNFQTEVANGDAKEPVGSLSYGFYRAVSSLPPDADYGLLFQRIRAFVQGEHPQQLPMMEGARDQLVFSGRYKPRSESILLTTVSNVSKDSVFKLDKGLMAGIAEGTTVSIYEAGGEKAIATGTVQRADHFAAFGTANTLLQKGTAYEARIETMNTSAFGVAVLLKRSSANKTAAPLETQMTGLLKSQRFVSIGETAEMLLDVDSFAAATHYLRLFDRNDSLRWQATVAKGGQLSESDSKSLLAALKNAARTKYLRTLPDGGQLSAVVKAELLLPDGKDADASLAAGDGFSIKLTNSGDDKLFYTVLDITPDNQVAVLYPTQSREPADYGLDKRSEVVRKLAVSKGTPAGREFFKIIVSKEPLDLRSVLEHRKQRAEMTSFQSALDDLFSEGRNTRAVTGIKAEEVGIMTVSLLVR